MKNRFKDLVPIFTLIVFEVNLKKITTIKKLSFKVVKMKQYMHCTAPVIPHGYKANESDF